MPGSSGVSTSAGNEPLYVPSASGLPVNINSIALNPNSTDAIYKRLGGPEITLDEYISPKRRRKLNQIVPNPRKPRLVQYQCSCCVGEYQMLVHENAWWAVYVHECPICQTHQIPRIDINLSINSVELDPNIVALYGEGMDDEEEDGGDEDSDEDEDSSEDALDSQEEEHPFGTEGTLAAQEASKLLVLMCHARTCTGSHSSPKHAEICKSTKFLMLHIRDCNGFDNFGNECKFPWCTPCKRMLQHLTRCYQPDQCTICNPFTLPETFKKLQEVNNLRSQNVKKN